MVFKNKLDLIFEEDRRISSMKKVIALSAVLTMGALGMACGDAAPANNAANKANAAANTMANAANAMSSAANTMANAANAAANTAGAAANTVANVANAMKPAPAANAANVKKP